MNITKTEKTLKEITEKINKNLQKLNTVNIADCEDDFEIDMEIMNANMENELNDTYKLIKELCNFNNIYGYENPVYDYVEQIGKELENEYYEYNFVECINIIQKI